VLRQGLTVILAGLVAGVLGSLALGRTIETLLYGVAARDPVTYALVPAVVVAVGTAACLVPAWRATSIDPLRELRT
jgi:ABC-type antimicrobial peptide transport system permease subunit